MPLNRDNILMIKAAARDGNLPIVKTLLSYNASPDITDAHGWSAIQYAGRSPEIVQLYEEALRCKRHELAVSLGKCIIRVLTTCAASPRQASAVQIPPQLYKTIYAHLIAAHIPVVPLACRVRLG